MTFRQASGSVLILATCLALCGCDSWDGSAAAEESLSPSSSEQESAPVQSGPARNITFDDIKFDIEKDGKFERSMLTPEIEALQGQRIVIRGYITPLSVLKNRDLTDFVLVRDNQECCFGPGAAIYDCIKIELDSSHPTDFTVFPIAVEGTFRIDPIGDEERLWSLYKLVHARVR